jgi:hypothetical protein
MARKHHGTGSLITIRRMKGIGALNQPASALGSIAPPALGVILAGLTALGLRYWVDPSQGATQAAMFKWAPLVGLAVNGVGSALIYFLAGAPAAFMQASAGSLTAGILLAHDAVMSSRAAAMIATSSVPVPAPVPNGVSGRMGVVIPQNLMGPGARGIVMEPAANRNPYRRYGISGAYGESVNVGSINPSAFGTPGN